MLRSLALASTLLIATLGCRADREVFDEGATMETPPAVEQAPATPIPPQPLPPRGSPADTVAPPIDPDTITADAIRPPA